MTIGQLYGITSVVGLVCFAVLIAAGIMANHP
jgi:tetrahydromethanopterin S-methyltransferase subunit G